MPNVPIYGTLMASPGILLSTSARRIMELYDLASPKVKREINCGKESRYWTWVIEPSEWYIEDRRGEKILSISKEEENGNFEIRREVESESFRDVKLLRAYPSK